MSAPSTPDQPKHLTLDGYIIPSKYMLGPATKILLLLTTAFGSTFGIAYQLNYSLVACNCWTKVLTFECVMRAITLLDLSARILIFLFGFNMDHFRKFISTVECLTIEMEKSTVQTIKWNRRFTLVVLTGRFIICIIIFIKNANVISKNTDNGIDFTLSCFYEALIRFGRLFLLNMVCNICICLKAAFNQINLQIVTLNERSNPWFGNLFHEIRDLRQKYSYAVRSTQSAEKLFRYFLTLFYIEYFSYNVLNIVRSFGPKANIDSIWLLFISLDAIVFTLLTYNLISVNNLSRQGLEDLYELSFKLYSPESCHENDIFIARMALSDVGFTFANLFTINNNFITSLFTLSLTVIIALASFIYK